MLFPFCWSNKNFHSCICNSVSFCIEFLHTQCCTWFFIISIIFSMLVLAFHAPTMYLSASCSSPSAACICTCSFSWRLACYLASSWMEFLPWIVTMMLSMVVQAWFRVRKQLAILHQNSFYLFIIETPFWYYKIECPTNNNCYKFFVLERKAYLK